MPACQSLASRELNPGASLAPTPAAQSGRDAAREKGHVPGKMKRGAKMISAIWTRVSAIISAVVARDSLMPGVARYRFGRRGEEIAVRYVRGIGYRIVARNYRAAGAEIDIVAMDGETLVFVEVKRRTGISAGAPEEAVGPAKQAQIRRAAEAFVGYHRASRRDARFDVIAIIEDGCGRSIRHFKEAF
jgi:putative endonuclease